MNPIRLAVRSLVTGTLTTIATNAVAAGLSKASGKPATAPLNATSAVAFGEKAHRREHPSMKYTLVGLGLNYAASLAWGALYERMRHGRPATFGASLMRGTATAATAYAIDHFVMPRRLQSGFDKKLEGGHQLATYAAMALSLPIRELINRRLRWLR